MTREQPGRTSRDVACETVRDSQTTIDRPSHCAASNYSTDRYWLLQSRRGAEVWRASGALRWRQRLFRIAIGPRHQRCCCTGRLQRARRAARRGAEARRSWREALLDKASCFNCSSSERWQSAICAMNC